jgi:hypothetical protein
MVDEVTLRKAVDTAWTVYLATHRNVDVADDQRCLPERHLQRSLEAGQSGIEVLTCSGLAYLDPASQGRMVKRIELLIGPSRKREVGLDVARPLVPASSDAGFALTSTNHFTTVELQQGEALAQPGDEIRRVYFPTFKRYSIARLSRAFRRSIAPA